MKYTADGFLIVVAAVVAIRDFREFAKISFVMISLFYNAFLYAFIFYLAVLFLLIALPYPFQPLAMYLHFVNFPFGVDWSKGGERFGFRGKDVEILVIWY